MRRAVESKADDDHIIIAILSLAKIKDGAAGRKSSGDFDITTKAVAAAM